MGSAQARFGSRVLASAGFVDWLADPTFLSNSDWLMQRTGGGCHDRFPPCGRPELTLSRHCRSRHWASQVRGQAAVGRRDPEGNVPPRAGVRRERMNVANRRRGVTQIAVSIVARRPRYRQQRLTPRRSPAFPASAKSLRVRGEDRVRLGVAAGGAIELGERKRSAQFKAARALSPRDGDRGQQGLLGWGRVRRVAFQ